MTRAEALEKALRIVSERTAARKRFELYGRKSALAGKLLALPERDRHDVIEYVLRYSGQLTVGQKRVAAIEACDAARKQWAIAQSRKRKESADAYSARRAWNLDKYAPGIVAELIRTLGAIDNRFRALRADVVARELLNRRLRPPGLYRELAKSISVDVPSESAIRQARRVKKRKA
jgi:hypothetical protein